MAGFMAGSIVGKMVLDRSKWSGGVKAVGKDSKTMGKWVKQNSKQFKQMGLAIAAVGTAAVVAFSKMVKKFVETGDMIDKMSKRTGFAAETLSELAHAADISGADITALEKGVKKMSKSIVDASFGLETYLRVFRGLGLEIVDLLNLSPEEQFLKIGNAIADMESDTLRTAAAVDVFGRAGTQLIPLFKEGSEGIRRLREEAHKLGIVFDKEAAAKAAKLKDAQTNLKASFQGLGFAIAEEFIPILTNVTEAFTDMVVDMGENTKLLVSGMLDMFKLVVEGIQNMMLAWQGFKLLTFEAGKGVAGFAKKGLNWFEKLLKKADETFPAITEKQKRAFEHSAKFRKALIGAATDLGIVEKGFREESGKLIDGIAKINAKFDEFKKSLSDIKFGLTEGKKEIVSYSETIVKGFLPAGRDMSWILEDIRKKTKEAEKALKKKTVQALMMTEAEGAAFYALREIYTTTLESLLGVLEGFLVKGENLFKALGNALKTFGLSLVGTMKNLLVESMAIAMKEILMSKAKALAGIIASIVKSLGFPANVLAIGAGIALINKLFSALPSFAEGGRIGTEGGIVGERGPELFAPDRPGTIIPLKGGAGMMRQVTNVFSPTIHLNTLDPMTARDVVRDQIMPELLEAWKNKLMLREAQEALEIF